jgi:hypothetical protein
MRCNFPRKNVDFSVFVDKISAFFKDKGFKAVVKNDASRVFVSVELEGLTSKGRKIADVILESNADGSVMVIFDGGENSTPIRMSSFLSLLGGGFLTLKSLEHSEMLERLEKDFWDFVDGLMSSV